MKPSFWNEPMVTSKAAFFQSWAAPIQYLRSPAIGSAPWRRALVYGLRFWISVCAALFIAFWLQLDEPYWAGTSAAVACLPQVGPSLRKGWLRLMGTGIGAIVGVVLAACFAQDRPAFFVALAAWGAVSAFSTTLLRNYSSYAAALMGYTAAIVAGGSLGASGGVHSDAVFQLAVWRFTEICVGIVCAGVIRILTDRGDAEQRLARAIEDLVADMLQRFLAALATDLQSGTNTQSLRREFIKRTIALEPIVEQAMGESSRIRFSSPLLQRMTDGLFVALASWRAVEIHVQRMPEEERRRAFQAVLPMLSVAEAVLSQGAEPAGWRKNPRRIRDALRVSADKLAAFEAETPSLRLIADKTAEGLFGLAHAFDGLLLVINPESVLGLRGRSHLRVPDFLPAIVNGIRSFLTVGATALLWIITGWPNGDAAMTFALVITVAQVPRGDGAYAGGLAFSAATIWSSVLAMIATFIILPLIPMNFPALALALGCVLVPTAASSMILRKPAWLGGMMATSAVLFMPFLEVTNPMTYDAADLLNKIPANVAGCLLGAMAFRLIPPLTPAYRTRRLLSLTLKDISRFARGAPHEDWSGHILGRLIAMSAHASPLQRASLVVAFSTGSEIEQLRRLAEHLGFARGLQNALDAIARLQPEEARQRLADIDAWVAEQAPTQTSLRVRAGIAVLSEALAQHSAYFAGRIPA